MRQGRVSKTVIFSEILKGCAKKETPAIMVVRGRKLVDQASQRLLREEVPHGVFMAGHSLWRPHRPIQICSIDTLRSRRRFPPAKVIIIDECHLAASESFRDFISHYPDAYILGVTATPYIEKDFSHIAEKVIAPISMKDLVTQNYLLPAKYYVPFVPNLQGVKINSHDKDYNKKQLFSRMCGVKIVGKIVEHWKMLGENRPTLCFAVSVAHSQEIVERFNSHGVSALHCDADTPEKERNVAIEKLRTGEIKILSNVGLFMIGVDIPFVSCLLLARPTKSLALHIQICGRGTRLSPETGKKDFIILDHSGNVLEHGPIDVEHPPILDGQPVKKVAVNVKICKECFAAIEKYPCVYCGFAPTGNITDGRKPEEDSENFLTEYQKDGTTKIYQIASEEEILREIKMLDEKAARFGLKPGFVWHSIRNVYGPDVARKYLSHRFKRSSFETPQSLSSFNFKVRP